MKPLLKWKLLFTSSFLLLSSCNTYNSSSGDRILYSSGPEGIFQSKCSTCHDYSVMTQQEFIDESLVLPGRPTSSLIFRKLKGSNDAIANMPPSTSGIAPLTTSELDIIKTWIQNM